MELTTLSQTPSWILGRLFLRKERRNEGQERVEEGKEIEKKKKGEGRGQCFSALPDPLAGF